MWHEMPIKFIFEFDIRFQFADVTNQANGKLILSLYM